MKIILIGASGTLGKTAHAALKEGHEIVTASRSSGDFRVDINEEDSIRRLYQQVGAFDALVSCTGYVHFAPIDTMSREQFQLGLNNKLMGQVQLVMLGLSTIRSGGSFTLTSGPISDTPIVGSSSAVMVNAALQGFVQVAALELQAKGLRINLVSPTIIEETWPNADEVFPGFKTLPAADAALGYVKSVKEAISGQILRMGW